MQLELIVFYLHFYVTKGAVRINDNADSSFLMNHIKYYQLILSVSAIAERHKAFLTELKSITLPLSSESDILIDIALMTGIPAGELFPAV